MKTLAQLLLACFAIYWTHCAVIDFFTADPEPPPADTVNVRSNWLGTSYDQ